MQSSAQEVREYCKKIEVDMNQKLFSAANSINFIAMVNEALACHVSQVLEIRKSAEAWLEHWELPNRDDVANIARKQIEIENRLDCLDEDLYQTWEKLKETQKKLAGLDGQIKLALQPLTEETFQLKD